MVSREHTHREAIFENDSIKAWKSVITPDSALKLHRHDQPRLVTVLRGGTMKQQTATGETLRVVEFEKGKSYWLEADPEDIYHYCVNTGGSIIEVVVVETKR